MPLDYHPPGQQGGADRLQVPLDCQRPNGDSGLVTPLETAVRVAQLVALIHEEKRQKEESEQEREGDGKEDIKDGEEGERPDGEEEVKCPEIRIHHTEEEESEREEREEVREEKGRAEKDFKIYLEEYFAEHIELEAFGGAHEILDANDEKREGEEGDREAADMRMRARCLEPSSSSSSSSSSTSSSSSSDNEDEVAKPNLLQVPRLSTSSLLGSNPPFSPSPSSREKLDSTPQLSPSPSLPSLAGCNPPLSPSPSLPSLTPSTCVNYPEDLRRSYRLPQV